MEPMLSPLSSCEERKLSEPTNKSPTGFRSYWLIPSIKRFVSSSFLSSCLWKFSTFVQIFIHGNFNYPPPPFFGLNGLLWSFFFRQISWVVKSPKKTLKRLKKGQKKCTQCKIPHGKIVSLSTEGQIKALFSSLFDYFFISYEGEAKNDLYRDTKVDT